MPSNSDFPHGSSLPTHLDGNSLDAGETQLKKLIDKASERAVEAEDEGTLREYRRAMRSFEAFCDQVGVAPMRASEKKVINALVAYIEHLAREGYAVSTIEKRVTGVRHFYRRSGRESPTEHRSVRKAKKNVKHTVGSDRGYGQKDPVLIKHLQQMDFDTSHLLDLRDRAMLFVGFAGGLRRSELVGLEMRDASSVEGGMIYRIRDPKTSDQPETVQIPDEVPALDPTPNDALRKWLDAAEINSGALFRRVDRWGNISDSGSHGDTVYYTVREWMESIGEDPDDYGAHSLRAGFATQAHLDGVPDQVAATQTRHSQVSTLHEYQRVSAVRTDHPLSQMGTEERE